jgi:hypothetical protein
MTRVCRRKCARSPWRMRSRTSRGTAGCPRRCERHRHRCPVGYSHRLETLPFACVPCVAAPQWYLDWLRSGCSVRTIGACHVIQSRLGAGARPAWRSPWERHTRVRAANFCINGRAPGRKYDPAATVWSTESCGMGSRRSTPFRFISGLGTWAGATWSQSGSTCFNRRSPTIPTAAVGISHQDSNPIPLPTSIGPLDPTASSAMKARYEQFQALRIGTKAFLLLRRESRATGAMGGSKPTFQDRPDLTSLTQPVWMPRAATASASNVTCPARFASRIPGGR